MQRTQEVTHLQTIYFAKIPFRSTVLDDNDIITYLLDDRELSLGSESGIELVFFLTPCFEYTETRL